MVLVISFSRQVTFPVGDNVPSAHFGHVKLPVMTMQERIGEIMNLPRPLHIELAIGRARVLSFPLFHYILKSCVANRMVT